MADERNDSGTTPALILFVIIMQDYPDQCSLSTLGSLSQSRRRSGDDAPCPFIPLGHFYVFTTPHSGCRASCGTAMPAEMPAVRVAHHRAVLLEHPSQLELKFGGSGAVARPRRAPFNDVAELFSAVSTVFELGQVTAKQARQGNKKTLDCRVGREKSTMRKDIAPHGGGSHSRASFK